MERGRAQQPQRSQQRTQGTRRPRRRKKKYTLHYLILFLFCIGLGLTLCMNVLFKVSSIQVKNNTYYSAEELISRSGISQGDKLFGINAGDTEKMLEDRFPYLQSVQIKRQLPSTVIIRVVEEAPMGAAYTDEGFAIISNTGKVLKNKVNQAPSDMPVLLGLEEQTFTVGSYLYERDENNNRVIAEKVQMIQRFLETASEQAFSDLTYIEITDIDEIKVLYDERILIDFGSELDLAKKITFVQKVLADGIADNHPLSGYNNENFEGSIDITDRKQLRTRALAVDTIANEKAFAVFEDAEAFFAEDEEITPSEEVEIEAEAKEIPEENAAAESSEKAE